MIIHSPIFSGSINQAESAYANLSGSFSGSFRGIGQFEGLEADSVAYENVTGKPTLVSGSSQVSYPDLSNIPSGIISSSAQIDTLFNIDGLVSGGGEQHFIPLFKSNSELTSSYLYQNGNTLKTFDFETGLKGINLSFVNDQYSLGNFINPTGSAITVASNNGITEIRNRNYTLILDKLLVGDLGSAGYTEALQVSGSIRATGAITGTSFNGTINANNGVVSGSSQVSYPDLSNIPAGIVSGSSQIDLSNYVDKTTGQVIGGDKSFTNQVIFNNTVTLSGGPAFPNSVAITGQLVNGRRIGVIQFGDYILTGSLEQLGNQIVTGSINVDGDVTATSFNGTINANNGVVSGSSQVSYPNLSNIPAGIVSSSSQISYPGLSNIPAGIVSGSAQVTPLLPTGVVSGSTQVQFNDITNNPFSHSGSNVTILAGKKIRSSDENTIVIAENLDVEGNITLLGAVDGVDIAAFKSDFDAFKQSTFVTGSSQVTYANISSIPAGIVSGSSQITPLLPSGVVSGSSQVNADSITNFDSNVKDKLNADLVVSGSASDVKTFLSLQNVTNESKATMFTNAALTGTPTAPTAPANTNSTQIATTAYVQQELTDLIGGANEAFDTLLEISASLASGDSTLNTLVDGKLSKSANLSDLTNTSTARTNLGVAIGTNVQAYNIILESVASGSYAGDDSISILGTITTGNVTQILPTGVVSGSSQINVASTTGDIVLGTRTSGNYVATITAGNGIVSSGATSGEGIAHTISVGGGVVSGSSQITYANISSIPAGIVSGSAQVTPLLPTGVISGSSQVVGSSITTNTVTIGSTSVALGGTVTTLAGLTSVSSTGFTGALTGNASTATTLQTARTINGTSFNGSADITIPNLVSGSSQITAGSTTGFATSVKTQLDANTVVSGSSQINVASTTGDIVLGTRTSGNYVASLVAGTGVTITNNSGEGATPTIAIGQAVATNSEVQFAKVGVGGAHDATYELRVVGDIGATGDIVAYVSSDERLKNNVEVISNPIEKVQSLRGVTWEWNELASDAAKQSPNVGVIAQEVEKVLPQLVHDRENGFKGVDYAKLTGLLIEAIKEQQKQIDELKSRL